MNCEPPSRKGPPAGPPGWDSSARSIDGFCNRVQTGGHAITLFVSPRVADEHGPMFDESASRGIELALYLHPKDLEVPGYTNYLGRYSEQEQHELIEHATEHMYHTLGGRPRSFRGGDFAANDATFGVLYDLGYRQGSLSSPGRNVARQTAQWHSAEPDPHYVDRRNRLVRGDLGFLEVPVTTDAQQPGPSGFSPDLCIELGTFANWHRPLIVGQLERMANTERCFRTLCVFTHNRYNYHLDDDTHSQTVDALLEYFDSLSAEYTIIPTTVVGLHERWRAWKRMLHESGL